jgi:glucan-binding repeat-containing protein
VQQIGSHYYYFTEGGQMEYGTYKSSGSYTGWRTYSDGKRYFKRSSDEKYSYMSHGVTKVGDSYYYFDQNGYLRTKDNLEEETIVKFGSYYYAMDIDGTVTVSDMSQIDGEYYYFNSKGHMVFNTKCKIDGEYFLFDEDGYMVQGDGGTELYKFKNNIYAVRRDGSLVTGGCTTISGKKYYFNSAGVLQKNKIITIGKNRYYFNKTGQMVKNRTFKLSGRKYKASKSGVVTGVKGK